MSQPSDYGSIEDFAVLLDWQSLEHYRVEVREIEEAWIEQLGPDGRRGGESVWTTNEALKRLDEINERFRIERGDPRVFSIVSYLCEAHELNIKIQYVLNRFYDSHHENLIALPEYKNEIRKHGAREACCEARHFLGLLPRLHVRDVTSRPKLWCFLRRKVEFLTGLGQANKQMEETYTYATLNSVYRLLHRLRVPWAPDQPYPELSAMEREDRLIKFMNQLEADEKEWLSKPPEQLRRVSQHEAENVTSASPAEPATTARSLNEAGSPAKMILTRPSEKAIQCYRLIFLRGDTKSQAQAALEVYGDRNKQPQVSRDLKRVEIWISQGNILPDLASEKPKTFSSDPRSLDQGPRQKGKRR